MNIQAGGAVEKSVILNDVEVRYFVAGTSTRASTPVVLVHGAGGSTKAHWSYIFPMLARRHRVISIDLAPAGADRSLLELADFASQVIGVVEAEVSGITVGLLGYSLGASVAIAVAASRPDLVDRLMLVNGWLRTDTQQALRNRIWQKLRAEKSQALQDFMLFCAVSPDVLNFMPPLAVDAAAASLMVDDFLDQQMDLARRIDVSGLAAKVVAPTLIVGSLHDQIAPARQSKALFGAIDNSRYLEIASGHASLSERAAEVLRAADLFFDDPARHPAGTILEPLHL